jgi:hypothetical protein
MEDKEKLELNKLIRDYKGDNNFILSLKKQLTNSKFLNKIVVGKKTFKVLSDKQYEAAKSFFV